MKSWQVEYNATYWVEAETEDEAIEKGIEAHAELPDGSWEAFVDPYDSNNFNTLRGKVMEHECTRLVDVDTDCWICGKDLE